MKTKNNSEWIYIFGNNYDQQMYTWIAIERRFKERETMLEIY